ncbi:MAG: flagellar hook assembly protein FlgD [Alphaproteobacteria bacterium]|nr:flagellar hook assembly protein FlgD [Alphaproteobacteria bacterium]
MATDPLAVTGTSSAAADAAVTSKAAAAKNKIAKDMNTFLKLLTTQLKYQDPLSPMDSTKFTDQLVQFANVEQQIQGNSNLESIIKLQSGTQAAMAVNYIGKTVEADSTSLPLQGSKAEFTYKLPQEVTSSAIVIRDTDGKIVFNGAGQLAAGQHGASWEGTDNFGFPLADGIYDVTVTGTTATGESVQASTTVFAKVTGVQTVDNSVNLDLGGVSVPFDKILGVKTLN